MADKIIKNSKLDTFLSKLATKLASTFWRKSETTQISVDNVPTASSTNLVESGGVYSALQDVIAGAKNYALANSVSAWNTEVRAGSATPSVTLPAPAGTGVAEEIRYIFTAASANASFTAPSGYILGDDDGYSGLSSGNTLSYTDLTSGSIYECSFVVLDSTHISLIMKEHKTA